MALNYTEIGIQISIARHKAGLSQAQLCNLVNRDQGYLSRVESGMKIPSLELVVEIANALDISVDSLLGSNLKNNTDKDAGHIQFDDVLSGCSIKERQMMLHILKAVKSYIHDFS